MIPSITPPILLQAGERERADLVLVDISPLTDRLAQAEVTDVTSHPYHTI